MNVQLPNKALSALSILALVSLSLPTVSAQTVPPAVQVIDNASANGFTKTRTWYATNDSASYAGKYLYAPIGASTTKATWTFTNLTPGRYNVSVTYRPRSYFSTNAEFRVFDGGIGGYDLGATTVNQTVRASGDIDGTPWQALGVPGGHFAILMNSLSVTLSANSSARVQADAVRIERIGELSDSELLRNFARSQASIVPTSSGGEGEGPAVSQIDVLALYTDDLLDAQFHSSVIEFQTWVRRAFDCNPSTDTGCTVINGIPITVNGIMQASGVPVKFVVKNIMKSPVNDIPENVDTFTKSLDVSPEMNAARVAAGADVTVAFTKFMNINPQGYSGYPVLSEGLTLDQLAAEPNKNSRSAYVMSSNYRAISVIRLPGNIYGALTLVHELGHLLGSGHENYGTERAGLEPSARGYVVNGQFKTLDVAVYGDGIVTQSCPLGCSLIPIFSNPRLALQSNGTTQPLGTAAADNVSTMSKMAPIVATYSERTPIQNYRLINPENCLDKDGDGIVAPIDSLRVINYLNDGSETNVFVITNMRSVLFNSGFLDSNGDGVITPMDSLWIINHLNDPTNPAFTPATVCPR